MLVGHGTAWTVLVGGPDRDRRRTWLVGRVMTMPDLLVVPHPAEPPARVPYWSHEHRGRTSTGRRTREPDGPARRDWWHRDHPTFTALAGFFSGMLFVTVVPGAFVAVLRLLFEYETAEDLFPLVLLTLVVPIALLAVAADPPLRHVPAARDGADGAGRARGGVAGALLHGPRRRLTFSPRSDRGGGMIVGMSDRLPVPRGRRQPARCRSCSTSRAAARSRRATSPTSRPTSARSCATELGPARVPGQAALDPLLLAAGRRPGRDDRPPGRPARRAGRGAAAAADDAAAHARGRQGHHPQDAVEALRRRARRVRADALPRTASRCASPARPAAAWPARSAPPARAGCSATCRPPRSSSRSSPAPGRWPAARCPAARAASPTWSSWAWASRWPTTRPSSAPYAASPTRRPAGSACRRAASPSPPSASCRGSSS